MVVSEEGLTASEVEDWQAFMQMQEVLRSRLEQSLLEHASLSAADYTILAALSSAAEEHLRPSDLGELLGWEKSRLHHQLSRMCKRDLIERRAAPELGARAVVVSSTPAGRHAIRDAAPQHAKDVRRWVLDALSPEQLRQLGDASRAILSRL